MQTQENLLLTGVLVSPGLASGATFLFQDIFEREIRAYSIEPLLQAGIGTLSVAPPMVPLVKQSVRAAQAKPV